MDPSTKATFQRLADAVFTDRTDALVDGGKTSRNTSLSSRFSGDVRVSSTLSREEKSALSQLRGRKSRLESLGEKYSSANTSVSLDRTRLKGRHATVNVTETTTLTYEKVKGNEPKTTGFQAHHELTFKADRKGDWQLTGIRDTDDGVAVNQVAATTFVAAPKTAADDAPPSATRSVTTWPAFGQAEELLGLRLRLQGHGGVRGQVLEQLQLGLPELQRAGCRMATAPTSSASP